MPEDAFGVGGAGGDALLAGVWGVVWGGGLERWGDGAVGGCFGGFVGGGRGFAEVGVGAHFVAGVVEVVGRWLADLYAGGE